MKDRKVYGVYRNDEKAIESRITKDIDGYWIVSILDDGGDMWGIVQIFTDYADADDYARAVLGPIDEHEMASKDI